MKVLQLRINDKIIEEKILEETSDLIITKNYKVKKIFGRFDCKIKGFKGASIINRGVIKNLIKKIGV